MTSASPTESEILNDSPRLASTRGSLVVRLLPLHRALVVTLVMTYAAVLIAILRWTISEVFAYEGYGYFEIRQWDFLLWTWGLVFLGAFALPIRVNKPSQFFVWLIYLVVYIPALLIPPYASGIRFDYVPMQGVFFVSMIALAGVGLLPTLRLPGPGSSLRMLVTLLAVYSAVVMLWLVLRVGIPTTIPSFSEVYVQRAAFGSAIGSAGPVLYLVAWQTSVVNPLLLLIGLSRRKWLIFLIGIGLNVLMYAMAGHKSHLLSSVLVIAVYILLRFVAELRGILVSAGAISIMVITHLAYVLGGAIYPISIVVRRMFMVPGMLTGYYFVYFSNDGFTQRFGPLSIFLNPVRSELNTPKTIGLEFFDRATMAANANFWADAYSALGYIGMFIATVLLVMVLWAMDSLSVTRTNKIVTPLFVVALFSLTNSALPTSLLTHGILFAMLMVWMLPVSGTMDSSVVRNRNHLQR